MGWKMKLVTGGYAQGKLAYVLEKYGLEKDMVWHGVLPETGDGTERPVVVDRLHDWVKKRILEGGCPEEEILAFLNRCGDCIMICDEIGNGIVPMEPLEREYRERTGRIVVELAKRAEEVERVICGIGQKIK